MDVKELKNKLRKLKRIEAKLRYGAVKVEYPSLVWNKFFDLSEKNNPYVKYTWNELKSLSHSELKLIIEEYWASVYSGIMDSKSLQEEKNYDRSILEQLELPLNADETMVKERFRNLAKQYHPDAGGDPYKFIELMELYRKLYEK